MRVRPIMAGFLAAAALTGFTAGSATAAPADGPGDTLVSAACMTPPDGDGTVYDCAEPIGLADMTLGEVRRLAATSGNDITGARLYCVSMLSGEGHGWEGYDARPLPGGQPDDVLFRDACVQH